ncbi:MAG TPA: RNA methyltransferase [Gemmatimonadaceae bacterium]|nr:RNA methyltransferase [Gemmatimonadaceae bacterium]
MKLLTLARDLRRRRARERQRLFVAEGVRAVEELLASPLAVRGLLVAPQLADAPRGAALVESARRRAVDLSHVDEREFASAAETESPQGVLAIAEIPERRLDDLALPHRTRLVVLDAVQDPGNVGTILRTSAALGAAAVVAMPGTVDLWNAKVVRSAMGALFHSSVYMSTWAELDTFRARHAVVLWGAEADGTPLERVQPPDRLALLVGNEGAGLSSEGRARIEQSVSIPIASTVESLNVAVATGIILYQVRS